MQEHNEPIDYEQLRENLQDLQDMGDLDEHVIDEILHAVYETYESEFAIEWRDPAYGVQSENDKKIDNAAHDLEKAANDFQRILDKTKTGHVHYAHSTIRDELQQLIPTITRKLGQLRQQVRDYKKRGPREDPGTFLVRQVAQAIRRYGHERQDRELEDDEDSRKRGRHKKVGYGLLRDDHLALVIRDTLAAIGHPTKLPNDTLLKYARGK